MASSTRCLRATSSIPLTTGRARSSTSWAISNGSETVFNSGSTVTVQVLTDTFTPTSDGPSCADESFTAETSNLNLVAGSCCPIGESWPGIQFTESNAANPTFSCGSNVNLTNQVIATSTPSIFVRPTGEADIVEEANSALVYFHASPGGAWYTNVIAQNAAAYSAPSIVVRPSGEADVAVQGPYNSLVVYSASPGVAVPTTVAPNGSTFSAPRIAVRPTGELDVVAQGPNDSLLYYLQFPGGGWDSSTVAGNGTTASAPSIFVRANGEADIVAQTPGNELFSSSRCPDTLERAHDARREQLHVLRALESSSGRTAKQTSSRKGSTTRSTTTRRRPATHGRARRLPAAAARSHRPPSSSARPGRPNRGPWAEPDHLVPPRDARSGVVDVHDWSERKLVRAAGHRRPLVGRGRRRISRVAHDNELLHRLPRPALERGDDHPALTFPAASPLSREGGDDAVIARGGRVAAARAAVSRSRS